jgi:hypothetical protein
MKRLGLAGLLLCVVLLLSQVLAHPTSNNFVTVFLDTNGGGLTGEFSGWVITNRDAMGTQTFNLPPAVTGMHMIFALSAAQEIVVNPDDNDQILGFSGVVTGDAIKSSPSNIGTTVELVAIDDSRWLPIRQVGTWIDANP